MPATPSRDDLRLPADAMICYYCLHNGQGTTAAIASSIDRRDKYVSHRLNTLESYDVLERVDAETGPVTLAPAGVELARELAAHIRPDVRARIEAATPYSVTWD